MDYFLNFKNKNYEAQYNESIEPYLSKIVRSNLITVVVVVPFLPYLYYMQYKDAIDTDKGNIIWSAIGSIIFVFLGVLAICIQKKWEILRKHRNATRWGFDILFNFIAGYHAYQFWNFVDDNGSPTYHYTYGWWHCFLCVTVFNPISRWYLKLSAYLIVILRTGIGVYLTTHCHLLVIKIIQMVFLEALLTYFSEKDRRKYFIEKQQLYEETKVYKEIFDLTSDEVIIYGLQEGMMFRNCSNETHRWWKTDEDIEQNFKNIILKEYNMVSQLPTAMELDLNSFVQASKKPNFCEFLKHLTHQLNENLLNQRNHTTSSSLPSNSLIPGKLMVLTGSVKCPETNVPTSEPDSQLINTTFLLEIKILVTVFKEKPSLALVFSDITERSLVTILQENNNYKNRLLASVSHELRTPLNASINFTQEAIDHPALSGLLELKENYLVPALRSSQLLLNLINDILDFSQMSENKLRLVYENKNVYETLNDCLNLIKIQANRKGLRVSAEFNFEKGQNELFCTDHNRLKQIILNLLSNALKFTLVGEIRLTASTETLSTLPLLSASSEVIELEKFETLPLRNDQRILKVSISDTGIGISEENKAKLFKAFEKIELGEKSVLNAQGVGLGLVISNNLVLSLGPEDASNAIKVESEANKGTTFTFWIIDHSPERSEKRKRNDISIRSEDLCSEMKERMNSSSENENLETLHCFLPKKTLASVCSEKKCLDQPNTPRILTSSRNKASETPQILIVDDDIFNICALQMILSKLGYTCDAAYNGEQAIQKVLQRQLDTSRPEENKQSQYKMIFMDCNMPIMDGFEASRILKTKMKEKEIDPIAIVVCTAFIAEQDKVHATGIGVDSFCIKPVNREKIGDILNRYLPIKKSGHE